MSKFDAGCPENKLLGLQKQLYMIALGAYLTLGVNGACLIFFYTLNRVLYFTIMMVRKNNYLTCNKGQ